MTGENVPIPAKRSLREKASDEFKRFLIIFLYLWLVFGVMSIHKSVILSERHLDYQEETLAVVNAFIFAKVLLIGEHFNLGTRFNNKPLIYPILYKCLIFTIVLIGFHIVESILVGVWHGNTIANSLPPEGGKSLKGFLSMGAMCFIFLLPFFGFREIARIIGHNQMRALILEHRATPQ